MTDRSRTSARRIGVFYDGVTFKLISNYYRYEHARQARLNFCGLNAFLSASLSRTVGQCLVSESHLFIGVDGFRLGPTESSPISPAFQRAMAYCGVKPHYLPRNRYGEKGVDMELGLEMLTAGITRRIDIAALVATDGDFETLALRMRALNVPVVLLAFHLPQARPKPICLSCRLTDAVSCALPMPDIIDRPPVGDRSLVGQIFLEPTLRGAALPRCA